MFGNPVLCMACSCISFSLHCLSCDSGFKPIEKVLDLLATFNGQDAHTVAGGWILRGQCWTVQLGKTDALTDV